MTKFILRRMLIAVPTLIGISLVLFTVISFAPGDPFGQIALNPNVPPEVQARLRKDLGIDDPVYIQYVRWAGQLARGNWGVSFVNKVPVWDLIRDRLPTTLFVVGAAYVFAVLIALPIGIISAVKQYSWVDNVATTFAFLGYSLPTFFTGLLFILVFTVKLGWLPEVYTTNIQCAGRDPPRLRPHGAGKGLAGALGHTPPRGPQRAHPRRHDHGAPDSGDLHRRPRDGADLPHSGDRLDADQRDQHARYACPDGRRLHLFDPRRAVRPRR
jgi:ABC-type dipeptide/oligopeptide/nickel transport system permease component